MMTRGTKRFAILSFAALAVGGVLTLSSMTARSDTIAFDIPATVKDKHVYQAAILGIGTHFGSMRILGYKSGVVVSEQIKSLGINSYRDGIAWSSFSFSPGQEPVMWQRRRIMDFMPIAGVKPLLVLAATAYPVAKTGAPFTDGQLAEFGAYVGATVKMTRQYDALYEVWNEYNMMVGYEKPAARLKGEGDPSDPRAAVHYAKLAKIAVHAAKAANPDAKIMVGAVGEDEDWKWATAIVRYGALDGADGLSVHLYNQCMRENRRTADELLTRLNDLQDKLKAMRGGRSTPLYVTEFGWPTMEARCNVSPERSAYNFAQYILQSATYPWLKGSWIYELKDENVNPNDLEANFGVFKNDDSPKPAACFVKSAREIVANARSIELRKLRPDVFAVRAVLADKQVVALWSNDMSPSGKISLAQQPVSAKAMCGAQVDSHGVISISQVPLLLSYKLDQQISLNIKH